MDFEKEVIGVLKKAGLKDIQLVAPPNSELGDLSFACFRLGNNPAEKAKELAEKLKPYGLISRIESVGPYVNFFADNQKLSGLIVRAALKKDFGKGKAKGTALIEHTSTNPNADPHVGRARNAIIGDSLTRIFRFYGYKTDVRYFVNDIGKQIAMLVYSAKDKKKKINFEGMLKDYIEMNRKVIESVSLEKEVLNLLYKYEHGDSKTKTLFRKIVSTCIKGQINLLSEMNIKYDNFDYESRYIGSKLLKDILKKLKPHIRKSDDGRIVLNLEKFSLPMKSPFVPITREDGTSLYFLRDIAYNVEKAKWAKKGKNIVVLGEDHKLEYMQVKSALSLLGIPAPEVVHYSFILLPDGKMSTRAGNIVLLSDFMREAVEKARQEILKRNPEIAPAELDKTAKIIGYSAIKYAILKVGAEKNVTFNWEDALNFEGNSAPYILYTYVRSKKILEKFEMQKKARAKLVFSEPEETSLIKKMAEFPSRVEHSAKNYEMHSLARYCFELSSLFNVFYEKCGVIQESDEIKRNSRLNLVKAYNVLIKNCCMLLGMQVPDSM